MMDLNEYQRNARRTAIYPGKGEPNGLVYTALKLAGEAGEVSDNVGKAIRDDKYWETGHLNIDRYRALAAELGDVLWYVANMASELDLTLEDIARGNLQKLESRRERGVLRGSGDDR